MCSSIPTKEVGELADPELRFELPKQGELKSRGVVRKVILRVDEGQPRMALQVQYFSVELMHDTSGVEVRGVT